MADISGYNICEPLTLDSRFGEMFGFTQAQVMMGLKHVQKGLKDIDGVSWDDTEVEKAMKAMTAFLNGYRFVGSNEALYNPQLSIRFLDRLLNDKEQLRTSTLANDSIDVDACS